MTNKEAVKWLINLIADIGKSEYGGLWHYEQALSEIKEMLEKGDWTPCSDRPPEKEGRYLITIDEDGRKDVGDDLFYFRGDGTPSWFVETNVIAWMHLPEPYRGEKDD